MFVHSKPKWQIEEKSVTPENIYINRRSLLRLAGGGLVSAVGGGAIISPLFAANNAVPVNPKFKDAGRKITSEKLNTTYNNFYEFGSSKRISRQAEKLKLNPWDIQFDGLIEKPFTIAFEELIKKFPLEERVYRHRCVEAWSMVVPWTGFSLRHLVAFAKPLSSAKYVRFETFLNPDVAQGQKPPLFGFGASLPWPYVEGVTMDEAENDLAFMVTGAYGKSLPKSMGAPIRLHLPWKYGFKSIKSLVRISFTKERPISFWETQNAREYGFWANVNPKVDHPRWSQASERILGTDERVPTQLFNGYGEYVANLYANLKDDKYFR